MKFFSFFFSFLFFSIGCFSEEKTANTSQNTILLKDATCPNNQIIEVEKNTKPILTAIRFVSSMEEFSEKISFEGIKTQNIFVPRGFISFMKKFLGRELDLELLNQIKYEATNYYKKKGYLFTFIAAPPQSLADGQISFVVLIGKLGEISVTSKYCSASSLIHQMSLKKEGPITKNKINQDSMWLNSLPFRESLFIFKPGKVEGHADLKIDLKEKFPLRIYGTFERNGYFLGGSNRYITGINKGFCWPIEQLLNYQFISGNSVKEYLNHTADYKLYFPWQNILNLFGSYSKSHTDDGSVNSKGKAYEIKAHYEIPLALGILQNSFIFGYEFKRNNNFQIYHVDFPTADLLKDTDISQFLLEYQTSFSDRLGNTSIRSLLYLSPGYMTEYNRKRFFITERPNATPSYVYLRAYIDKTIFLPVKFLWVINASFQLSTNKLLPSEQFSLGGYYTLRGYKENQVISDNGVNIRNELRTPPCSFFKGKKDFLQFLAFLDFGRASNIDEHVLHQHSINLLSTGFGIRFNFKEYLIFRLDQGFQLKHIVDISERHRRPYQTHAALTLSY